MYDTEQKNEKSTLVKSNYLKYNYTDTVIILRLKLILLVLCKLMTICQDEKI